MNTTKKTTEKEKNIVESNEERRIMRRDKTRAILKILEGTNMRDVTEIWESVNNHFIIVLKKS